MPFPTHTSALLIGLAGLMTTAHAAPVAVFFEAAGATVADITPIRDAFRTAIGGGTVAGPAGSFGGVRREINWDGVPDGFADPNLLPGNFFNVNSARGAVFTTPGSGFLVSANAGRPAPILFGFPNDLATFSAQRLFAPVGSNITEVNFFVAGTNVAATTTAFGAIFTDVETAGSTFIEFFDENGALFDSRTVQISGNAGQAFLGATVTGGAISRVRIRSGLNSLVSNGTIADPNNDFVAMDDFIYAEPVTASVAEPSTLALSGLALAALLGGRRRFGWACRP